MDAETTLLGNLHYKFKFMLFKLNVNAKDRDAINAKYGREIDWALMSHCLSTIYNWSVPNRKKHTENIRIKLVYDDKNGERLFGWFYYGKTIYICINRNNTYVSFIKTVFHEFCHWNQYWVDGRSAHHMVTKRRDKWGKDDAEREAEIWEIIGKKAIRLYNILEETKSLHEYNEHISRNY
jgi:hypothetical protein